MQEPQEQDPQELSLAEKAWVRELVFHCPEPPLFTTPAGQQRIQQLLLANTQARLNSQPVPRANALEQWANEVVNTCPMPIVSGRLPQQVLDSAEAFVSADNVFNDPALMQRIYGHANTKTRVAMSGVNKPWNQAVKQMGYDPFMGSVPNYKPGYGELREPDYNWVRAIVAECPVEDYFVLPQGPQQFRQFLLHPTPLPDVTRLQKWANWVIGTYKPDIVKRGLEQVVELAQEITMALKAYQTIHASVQGLNQDANKRSAEAKELAIWGQRRSFGTSGMTFYATNCVAQAPVGPNLERAVNFLYRDNTDRQRLISARGLNNGLDPLVPSNPDPGRYRQWSHLHAELRLMHRQDDTTTWEPIDVDKLCCVFCAAQARALGRSSAITGVHFRNLGWYTFSPYVVYFGDRRRVFWGDAIEVFFLR